MQIQQPQFVTAFEIALINTMGNQYRTLIQDPNALAEHLAFQREAIHYRWHDKKDHPIATDLPLRFVLYINPHYSYFVKSVDPTTYQTKYAIRAKNYHDWPSLRGKFERSQKLPPWDQPLFAITYPTETPEATELQPATETPEKKKNRRKSTPKRTYPPKDA